MLTLYVPGAPTGCKTRWRSTVQPRLTLPVVVMLPFVLAPL